MYIPEVMKTGFGKPNFLFNFLQLLLCNRFFTVFFTDDFGFFFSAFWLGIWVKVDVDIILALGCSRPPANIPQYDPRTGLVRG